MSNVCSCTQKDGVRDTLEPNQYLETKKIPLKAIRETKGLRVRQIISQQQQWKPEDSGMIYCDKKKIHLLKFSNHIKQDLFC